MPPQNTEWSEVELPDIIKDWEVDDEQEGYYLGQSEIVHEGKPFVALLFEREDGTRWSTGGSAGLLPLFRDVPIRAYTKVKMTGTRDTGKPAPMKEFKVLIRK